MEKKHKAGFVNILGLPNMGKSTLLNAVFGEKLAIVTPKAQTTRHRMIAVYNQDDAQIVFSDTPGIITNTHYKMQESMMQEINPAFEDADIFIWVTDPFNKADELEDKIAKINSSGIPTLVVLNKLDLCKPEKLNELVAYWHKQMPKAEILPVSATEGFNLDLMLQKVISWLPENPPYYSKDELSDRPTRYFVSEMIREKIFLSYQQEIPYSCEVVINSYKEEKHIDKIEAYVIVERDSQKNIVIGKGGEKIKEVGIAARKDIEAFLQKKVFLDLRVKVDKDWRSNPAKLKRYGFIE